MPKKADKLLARAKRSAANFTLGDLRQLYLGSGFEVKGGGKHPEIVYHPKYPSLRANLPNHASFATGYVRTAVKLIEQLRTLEEEGSEPEHD